MRGKERQIERGGRRERRRTDSRQSRGLSRLSPPAMISSLMGRPICGFSNQKRWVVSVIGCSICAPLSRVRLMLRCVQEHITGVTCTNHSLRYPQQRLHNCRRTCQDLQWHGMYVSCNCLICFSVARLPRFAAAATSVRTQRSTGISALIDNIG